MNFTETFNEFSGRLAPIDLMLYAGIGIVLWVLFKDKMSPVQKIITDIVDSIKGGVKTVVPSIPKTTENVYSKDLFFDLVVSWKQTRDLAVQSGCSKAVEVADQMFPYLSPEVCVDKESTNAE